MSFIGSFKKIDNRALTALFAGLIPFGIAVPAYADSGVSISGRVVAGVQYLDNVPNGFDVNTGNVINEGTIRGSGNSWGTSLLNISGFHDLNDSEDLRAIFNLETGFDTADGSLNKGEFLNRRAYAGLQSDHWGTLLAGRNRSLSAETADIDPFYQQTASTGTLGRQRIWQDLKNVVGYNSPTWGGWYFQLQTSLGNDDDSYRDGRSDAIKVSYEGDAVSFHTVYDMTRDSDGKYTDVFTTSRQLLIGVAWHLENWDLYAGYNNLTAPDVAQHTWSENILVSGTGFAEKGNHYWLGANWAATDRWSLLAAVYQMQLSGKALDDAGVSRKVNGKGTLAALGTTYNFSDDFLFYATFGRVFNQNSTNFSASALSPETDYPVSGLEQNIFYFGFSYSFDLGFGAFAK